MRLSEWHATPGRPQMKSGRTVEIADMAQFLRHQAGRRGPPTKPLSIEQAFAWTPPRPLALAARYLAPFDSTLPPFELPARGHQLQSVLHGRGSSTSCHVRIPCCAGSRWSSPLPGRKHTCWQSANCLSNPSTTLHGSRLLARSLSCNQNCLSHCSLTDLNPTSLREQFEQSPNKK
jgi:hypothetical protein